MIVIHVNRIAQLEEPKPVAGGYVLAAPSFYSVREMYFIILLWTFIFFGVITLFHEFMSVGFSWTSVLGFSYFFLMIFLFSLHLFNTILKEWLITAINLTRGEPFLHSYPLKLGDSCIVKYRRQLKRGYLSQPGYISAKWRCYEWAQYIEGTSKETVTHTLWEINMPEDSISTSATDIEYITKIQVPSHHPPSFEAGNNQVRWELQIGVKLPGAPQNTSRFLLNVIPETI